jgi:hypothetical protein
MLDTGNPWKFHLNLMEGFHSILMIYSMDCQWNHGTMELPWTLHVTTKRDQHVARSQLLPGSQLTNLVHENTICFQIFRPLNLTVSINTLVV